MSGQELLPDPAFRAAVRATGHAEVWTHSHEAIKFGQFGWRCTNKESSYSDKTLVGNWNEERFDIEHMKTAKPLPSQYAHYFDSVCNSSYSTQPLQVPESLKNLKARHSHGFPGHQPELDLPKLQSQCNSWQTTSRTAYVDPKIQEAPVRLTLTGAN
ncbi:hypothetical protein CAPTEDRAFT_155736 [Capitella teleta]|uniref:Uncharacterized protein n=1 Tax=Capitella teleta TaxID=283909 RepID=R7TAB3_CAPTE|nr:hypothetical protein CAPTEDRAFT_155736 [Capitella teleta]|eukprot:ELT87954.1 hypothetical protein CAPTEDRAFT_155736 [Capitella teleta]